MEKIAWFPGGEKCLKSSHVSGCLQDLSIPEPFFGSRGWDEALLQGCANHEVHILENGNLLK